MAKQSAKYCVELRKGKSNKAYYTVVSTSNGQVCTTSQMYSSPSTRTRAAKRLAADAAWEVVDKTKE